MIILESCKYPYKKCKGYFKNQCICKNVFQHEQSDCQHRFNPEQTSSKVNHESACHACWPLVNLIYHKLPKEWRTLIQYSIKEEKHTRYLYLDFPKGVDVDEDKLRSFMEKYNIYKVIIKNIKDK
jgi:hypothetical protein